MTNRSVYLGLAAATFALLLGLPAPASAGPAPVVKVAPEASLVQEAGYYKRRWWRKNYDGDTHVRAPFTSVDSGRSTFVRAPFVRVYDGPRGTWVRAPFVNLFTR